MENRRNGRGPDGHGLFWMLFCTPQGWGTLAGLLAVAIGTVFYIIDARESPRLTTAEAAIVRLQASDSTQSRKLDYLICSRQPRPSNDVLALLGVRCWELPPATLEPPADDGA